MMMMEYIPIIISFVSLVISAVVGFSNLRATHTNDTKEGTTQLTTVIVKLENINDGVTEIKSDMRNMKDDVRELRDRVIACEQSTKSAHKRLDDYIGADHKGVNNHD